LDIEQISYVDNADIYPLERDSLKPGYYHTILCVYCNKHI